jgi:hypothetical protein
MTPAQDVASRHRPTSAPVRTLPLDTTGMDRAARTAAIVAQFAPRSPWCLPPPYPVWQLPTYHEENRHGLFSLARHHSTHRLTA